MLHHACTDNHCCGSPVYAVPTLAPCPMFQFCACHPDSPDMIAEECFATFLYYRLMCVYVWSDLTVTFALLPFRIALCAAVLLRCLRRQQSPW